MSKPEKSIYSVGDQPPGGYIARHEWAWVQRRGGLRQRRCAACSLWRFPQEMSREKGVCRRCTNGPDAVKGTRSPDDLFIDLALEGPDA